MRQQKQQQGLDRCLQMLLLVTLQQTLSLASELLSVQG
jgi:hypothetical protein